MEQELNREERLWDYIDETASPAERRVIEELLASNAEWKAAYGQLLEIRDALRSTELSSPSMRFTQNVMDELARTQITPAAGRYINTKIVWGIAGFLIVMVLGVVVYGLGKADWSSSSSKQNWADKLATINIGEIVSSTSVNIFMMVNVVIGLVLLDAYFAARRKKYQRR